MSEREYYVMFGGAYPRVPHSRARESNFIDLPNTHYDDVDGQRALEYQLELLTMLEDLGYDGGVFSEQHNGPIGLLGNPMLAGAWLAGQTKSIKIGVVGPIINAYLSPIRLAEEIATVDIMSRGRLVLGMPMGHGMQYHSIGMVNPATARARYREAHDLLMKALTHDGPFEWFGEFFQIPYVNLWPKPIQKPHPPIVILGGGSQETIELVAKYRYGYQSVGLNSRAAIGKTLERFRALCEIEGYTADPSQVWTGITFHVAETDKQAHLEAEQHSLWSTQNLFRSPFYDNFPPGYVSANSLRGILGGGYRSTSTAKTSYEAAIEGGNLIVGSPETVAERVAAAADEFGAGRVLLNPIADTKPKWLAMKSLSIFAEEVLPRLRKGGLPLHQHEKLPGFESASEFGARRNRDAPPPTADFGDGTLIDVSRAHIEELRVPVE